MATALPVIPTPLAQWWRECRVRVVPPMTFAGTIVAVLILWRHYVVPMNLGTSNQTNSVSVAKPQGLRSVTLIRP